jgi:hypothetical protein
MMTAGEIKCLLDERPFTPFRIVMSSGDKYEIRHPEQAFVTRARIYVGLRPDQKGIPEDSEICSVLQIAAVEPIKASRRKPTRQSRA